ncbi:MAG: hypothetical protein ABSA70_17180 [Terriglobia bacterium]
MPQWHTEEASQGPTLESRYGTSPLLARQRMAFSRATASALNAGWSPLAENYGAITAARASLSMMGGTRRRPSIVLTMVTVV